MNTQTPVVEVRCSWLKDSSSLLDEIVRKMPSGIPAYSERRFDMLHDACRDLIEIATEQRRILRSIVDAIAEAVNTKIRTGRMPNTAALLSEIHDSARSVL